MKKRFPALLLALSLPLSLPSMAAVIWNPESYEDHVAMLQNEEFYHIYDTVDTEFCTVIHYQRIGVPHIVAPQTAIFYKAGSLQGDGAAVYLPLDPESIRLSEDGKQIICTGPFDPIGGTEINTVDLTTGETIKTERIPPTQEEIIGKWFIPEGGSSTLETRLEAPDCSVILFWDEALGKRETFVRSYFLYLFYRDPESRKPEAGYQRLILPSTTYQDIYYPTDRAPDELFLNEDGSVLTYIYRFEEALYDLGGNQLHDRGTYTYRVDTATGELAVEHTPLPATAEETGTGFSDVSSDDWFAPYVEVCVEAGLMEGTGNGYFSPTKTLSGYECATLAMRLHNIAQGGDGSFEKAPWNWGYAFLTLPDGAVVREGYLSDASSWDLRRFSAADDGHLGFLLDTEEKQTWGRSLDYQKVTLTLDGTDYAGELHLDGYNFLYFELADDGNSLEGYDAIRDARSAPAPSAWWRDAWYYAKQNGLTNLLMEGNNHRWDFAYRMAAVTDLPAINEITGLPDTGDPDALELYRAGVLTGSDEYGTFHGELTLTRAEAAAICARILRPDLRVHFTPTPLPTEGYTLTHLIDGEPDCGICFPVFFLSKQDIMLTLEGEQLPWPTEEGASVPSWGLEPQDNYCYLAYYDLSTKDPYDTKGGLIDRTGAWVVPPENGRTSQTYPVEGGFFTRTHRGNVEVWGLLDEQGQWVRELEQTEDGPLTTYPFKAAQPLRGIVPSPHNPFYVDAGGTPVSQRFDWVSPITDDGQGFVGLEGKIYRIQFTKDPSAEI